MNRAQASSLCFHLAAAGLLLLAAVLATHLRAEPDVVMVRPDPHGPAVASHIIARGSACHKSDKEDELQMSEPSPVRGYLASH